MIYYYNKTGLNPMKKVKGKDLTYRNNYFAKILRKKLTTGIVTPYNGFVHIASVEFEKEILDMKIDTLGNIAILTEKEIHYFDLKLKNSWVL